MTLDYKNKGIYKKCTTKWRYAVQSISYLNIMNYFLDSDGKPISVIIIKVNIASPNQFSCSLGRCKSPRQQLALESFHVPVFTRTEAFFAEVILS